MSYTASPRVRRVRFAGLSTQSSNSAPLDGAIDTPNHPDLSPRRCEAVWTDLKKKTSWKDFVPKVEYPGWPAAAFKPPPFLQWLKYFLITLVIGTIFSGVALALFFMEPWKADRIQMHEAHLTRKLPTYGYTLVGNKSDVWGIVPIWSVLLLALGIPILIYLVSFLVIRSFWDFNNAFCGTNLACLSTFIISGFLKYLIGSPRPFFASICQPDLKRLSQGQTHNIDEVCTYEGVSNQDKKIALQSFPSGHAATAFAGFTFLSLWLRARMYSRHIVSRDRQEASSNAQDDGSPGSEEDQGYERHTHFLLSLLVVLPLWAASVIALLVVRDHIHHWWDAVGGAVIGILCAFNSWNNFYRGRSGIPVLPKGWAEKVRQMEKEEAPVAEV